MTGTPSPLLAALRTQPGTLTVLDGDGPRSCSWVELGDAARRRADDLVATGVGPGGLVALVGGTSLEMITTLQAAWWAGAAATVLGPPPGAPSAGYVEHLCQRLERLRPTVVATDLDLLDPLAERGYATTSLAASASASACGPSRPEVERDPASAAVVQMTSGTTGAPTPLVVGDEQLVGHCGAIVAAAELRDERFVSWLPLHHDMGLIGFLIVPMLHGFDLTIMDSREFARSPRQWLETAAAVGATVLGSPSLGYQVARRELMRRATPLDLSSVRLAFNGGEMIDVAATRAFVTTAADHGFDPGAMFAVYGMAEATLAVTFPPPGSGFRWDTIDPRRAELDHVAEPTETGLSLARLGRPLGDVEVRIVDPETRAPLPERTIGEIELQGPDLARHLVDDAPTSSDPWLRTGDRGYSVDDDLVVVGRSKDAIIIGGRTVLPQEVEWLVEGSTGVHAGRVCAFGTVLRSVERVVVVVEADPDPALAQDIRSTVSQGLDLRLADVVFVDPGHLPRTSSGKLQRARCRERYLAGQL